MAAWERLEQRLADPVRVGRQGKLYDGSNRKPGGKPSFLVAVICPYCPATYTLQSLGKRSYAALMGREEAGKLNAAGTPGIPG